LSVSRRDILKYLATAAVAFATGAGVVYVGRPPREVVREAPVTPAPRKAPETIKMGIVTFLSGPGASWFGVEGAKAAEMIIDKINAEGGIGGAKIKHIVIDEAGGSEVQVREFKRLVEDEKVDVVVGYISSADCLAVAPVAEELNTLTILYDCGTHRIFEEKRYKFVFRTKGHLTQDAVGAAYVALTLKPDLKRVSAFNQDYAWGRDNAKIFLRAIKKLKPDVEIVSDEYSKLYETEYTPFITKLLAAEPEVIYTSHWGGDAIAFLKQATAFGLHKRTLIIGNCLNNTIPALGADFLPGIVVGGRGPHWWTYPDPSKWPLNKWFTSEYLRRYGWYPVYPAYHMAQAILGYKYAVEQAIKTTGEWPDVDAIISAFERLAWPTPSGMLVMREDHNAAESMVYGIAKTIPMFPYVEFERTFVIDRELVTPPPGMKTEEWIDSW
jgi:branched-chain amino acid transport system substrate-binding protein